MKISEEKLKVSPWKEWTNL